MCVCTVQSIKKFPARPLSLFGALESGKLLPGSVSPLPSHGPLVAQMSLSSWCPLTSLSGGCGLYCAPQIKSPWLSSAIAHPRCEVPGPGQNVRVSDKVLFHLSNQNECVLRGKKAQRKGLILLLLLSVG